MKSLELFGKSPKSHTFERPYIIAEAGVNHEGKMEVAKRLIEDAAEGGADAIKFQTYRAATLASKNSPSYWDLSKEPTTSQYELFKKHDSFWKNEFENLKKYCDEVGIEFMSTPFDKESANFLNDLMNVYKISSSDITNKPFINYICQFNKPIILSTGASFLHEIAEAVEWIETNGNPLALLHCVLNYPTADDKAALGMIPALQKIYPDLIIGYSDHTLPGNMEMLHTASLLGARILEKHFTFDKNLPGNDHYHAMDKNDLKFFNKRISDTIAAIGEMKVRSLPEESIARKNARRSLVTARAIPTGKIIEPEDLTFKRPAFGISPRNYNEVIGMKARYNLAEDIILQWSDLEKN